MMKKLIVFDLDGTLTESKQLYTEMSELLRNLLGVVKVAVISGGSWRNLKNNYLLTLPLTSIWLICLFCRLAGQSSLNM